MVSLSSCSVKFGSTVEQMLVKAGHLAIVREVPEKYIPWRLSMSGKIKESYWESSSSQRLGQLFNNSSKFLGIIDTLKERYSREFNGPKIGTSGSLKDNMSYTLYCIVRASIVDLLENRSLRETNNSISSLKLHLKSSIRLLSLLKVVDVIGLSWLDYLFSLSNLINSSRRHTILQAGSMKISSIGRKVGDVISTRPSSLN